MLTKIQNLEFKIQICPYFPPVFTLVSCLAYALTLKMEATRSSETPVDFQLITCHCIPEDRSIHIRRCDSLKCYTLQVRSISL
jgi:hypothetical protein